jgi:outer membrane protein
MKSWRADSAIVARTAAWFAAICFSFPVWSETLTLEQVILEVCTKSDSVKMMEESIIRSDAFVRENKSAAYPKLSLSATINYSSPFNEEESTSGPVLPDTTTLRLGMLQDMIGGFATPKSSTTKNGALSLSVPIYTFGKIGTAIKVAENFNKSAHSTHERNIQTLQLTSVDMFFRTYLAIEAARIAERTLARKNDLYEFLNRNFNLGSGVKAQLLMTKADAFSQTAITIAAKRDAESARMFLNSFLGRPLTESWTIDTSGIPESLQKNIPSVSDTAINNIIEQRNDVLSLRLMAESNRGGAKIYRAMKYPSIYGSGSTGYTQIDSKGLMAREGAFDWSAGVSLSWSIFDGFQNSSKAAQYLSDARKLEIVVGTVKKSAEIEIRIAVSECSAADSSMSASQEMYGAAFEAFNLTNSNFKQGSGSLTDLQRVDEQLQLAEFGLLNARYRQVRSRAALLVAMGKDIVTIHQEERK